MSRTDTDVFSFKNKKNLKVCKYKRDSIISVGSVVPFPFLTFYYSFLAIFSIVQGEIVNTCCLDTSALVSVSVYKMGAAACLETYLLYVHRPICP